VTSNSRPVSQFNKPTGWLGRYMLWRMNAHHSKLTDWGLEHVAIGSHQFQVMSDRVPFYRSYYGIFVSDSLKGYPSPTRRPIAAPNNERKGDIVSLRES